MAHDQRVRDRQIWLGDATRVLSLAIASLSAIAAVWPQAKSIVGYIGLVLLLIAATSATIGGIFPSDPVTTNPNALSASGKMHSLGAMLGIPAMPLAVTFISWVLTQHSQAWASARRWLWLTVGLVWLSFVALIFLAFVVAKGTLGPDVLIGWPNRVFIIGYSLWLMVVAWHAIQLSPTNSLDPHVRVLNPGAKNDRRAHPSRVLIPEERHARRKVLMRSSAVLRQGRLVRRLVPLLEVPEHLQSLPSAPSPIKGVWVKLNV